MNGDGLDDLVVVVGVGDDYDAGWVGLVFAPFDTKRGVADVAVPLTPLGPNTIPPGGAVPAAPSDVYYAGVGELAMDLDGDGLSDLMDVQRGPDGGGRVSIWYGADIMTTLEARRQR